MWSSDADLYTAAVILDQKIIGDEIWMATDGEGLQSLNTLTRAVSKYTFKPNANSISNNNITCLLPEENGNLWIGTKGGGLNYFDRRQNIFYHYTAENGLCNNSVYCLVKDDKRRLWIGTGNGLSCFDTATRSFRNFFRADGLLNAEFNRYSACKLSNGVIFMGGMDGIDYFHPDSVLVPAVKPQVRITDFKVFNTSLSPNSAISLKHDQNYVTIDFAVMDFRNPSANKFQYMLEGIDKNWVDAGTEHSISYATLAPGSYHFLVRSAGNDGAWSETPAGIYFRISTPWWKSGWFYFLAGVAVIALLYSVYRFRIYQLKKVFAVRAKISQDLHDEVGATLTSISFLSEVIKKQAETGGAPAHEYLDKIGEFSREMIGEMNDIVWAINPNNDKFEKIEARMHNFASTLLAAKNIQLSYRSDGQIKNILLGMQQRKNLYLIFKEAVNNAAKYSNCREVTVRVFREDHHIRLDVRDDGTGFVVNNEMRGNGLTNMYHRAAEVNGEISIESHPGQGTHITFSMPITQNAYK